MTGDGGMDWLKQEVKIPETVQNKADEALARIREQAEKKEGAQTAKRMRRRSSRGKSIAAAILAAFLIVGTATAAVAAYMARMSAGLSRSEGFPAYFRRAGKGADGTGRLGAESPGNRTAGADRDK